MPQVVGNSMIGAVRSTGVNDWLAMASWGGALQAQSGVSSLHSSSKTKSSSTASNTITFAQAASQPTTLMQESSTALRIKPFTATQTIGQKSQIKENTAVDNTKAIVPNDAFAQLHALYGNPQTLADLQPARITMSSYDFAKLQEEQQSPEEQRQSGSKLFQFAQQQRDSSSNTQDAFSESAEDTTEQPTENITLGILAGYQHYAQQNEPALAPLHSIFG